MKGAAVRVAEMSSEGGLRTARSTSQSGHPPSSRWLCRWHLLQVRLKLGGDALSLGDAERE